MVNLRQRREPHDDVMIGVWNSVENIEKNHGVTLL
jgi:hypothetical protein